MTKDRSLAMKTVLSSAEKMEVCWVRKKDMMMEAMMATLMVEMMDSLWEKMMVDQWDDPLGEVILSKLGEKMVET